MQRDVFISYSRKYEKRNASIDKLCKILKQNEIDFWIDKNNEIKFGKNFGEEISLGIINSHCFMGIISKEYVDSPDCMKELEIAERNNKTLYLLMIEKVKLEKNPASAYYTVNKQYCKLHKNNRDNIWSGEIFDNMITQLVNEIKQHKTKVINGS